MLGSVVAALEAYVLPPNGRAVPHVCASQHIKSFAVHYYCEGRCGKTVPHCLGIIRRNETCFIRADGVEKTVDLIAGIGRNAPTEMQPHIQ
jgi:hypothetical protein